MFVLVSIYATFPLIFHFRFSFYGYPLDIQAWLWGFWWLKYSWLKGISPDFISILAYPFGVQNTPGFSIWNFFNKWLSIFAGDIVTFNLQILLSFFLSAVAMYCLVYYFTKNRPASFFSGLIFTLCPYHFAQSWDHLCLSNMHWVVFYILSLFILDRNQTYKNALITGLCFGLILQFSNPYYGYFMLIFTVLFFLFKIWYITFKKSEDLLKYINRIVKLSAVVLIIVAIIFLPQFWYFIKGVTLNPAQAKIEGYLRPFNYLFADSARPLNYFLPTQDHPLLGRIAQSLTGTIFYGQREEHSLYLGYVPLILAVIGYKRWRKRKKGAESNLLENFALSFFVFAFFVFIIFSLSPYWGKPGNFFIPFPSYFLYKIFPIFRNYARFGMLVMISVCVLAGFGLRDILRESRKPKKKIAIFCLATGLVLFEFLNIPPYKLTYINNVPEVYKWLKEQPGDFAVAEYPLDGDMRTYQFYQRIHQKPLVNGAGPSTPAYEFYKKVLQLSADDAPQLLNRMGVKYALVHLDTYAYSDSAEILGVIPDFSQMPGLEFVKKFDNVLVYQITDKSTKGKKVNQNLYILPPKEAKAEENIGVHKKVKFQEGERLIYNIKYMGVIPLGSLELKVGGITPYENDKVYHMVAEVETSRLFSLFFKAETKFESYIDTTTLATRAYEECLQIRGQPPKKKKVTYNLKEQIMEYRGGIKRKITPCPQDPISAIYYIRAQELEVGKKFNFNIEISDTNSVIEAEVIKRQKAKTTYGQINVYVVKAVLKTGAALKPRGTLIFWLSDDENRVLLLIKGTTPAGFVSIKLLNNKN